MATCWIGRGEAEPPPPPGAPPPCYVVTDIETDGPDPGPNSMRSFASVAVDGTGREIGAFAAQLAPLEGSAPDPATLAWFATQPGAWEAATRDPAPPAEAMARYAGWLRALPARGIFTAHPLAFDGFWMDWYLRRFLGLRLVCGPYGGEALFLGAGLDLSSLAMGALGRSHAESRREHMPPAWFAGHAHSHCALDDARGYAALLAELLRRRPAPG